MRTIFITLFQGVEAKNILRTDIYHELVSRDDVRLVFFVKTPERAAYYQKEFSHPRTIYEVVGEYAPAGMDRIFSMLKFFALRTATVDLRRTMALEEHRNPFRYMANIAANRFLSVKPVRHLMRVLDYRLVRGPRLFAPYFEKYRPSAVVCAHLFDDAEVDLAREAKRRGVKCMGFVNSWDKLTARNIMRLLPEKLIVFNELVKEEAIRHADMKERDIFVAGIPQYDWHVKHKPLSRSEFFRQKGLDSDRKLIVYAPMGKAFSNSDWDIIDLLHNLITNDLISNSQFLVRFPPNDFVDNEELQKRPWLKYDIPGIRFSSERGVDWDMDFNDIKSLTDTLANADLFVCYASSMSIDAAIFNKPVININFEVREKEKMAKSPTYFYQMTHYQNAVKSGGIRYPRSKKELIDTINMYLQNPAADKEGRARLVREQCGILDGKAGVRIAECILSKL